MGRWKVNGDTICLNGDRLLDGQHRLAAVVASGVTIQSFVIDGLPSDVFNTKDVGKRRSGGDTLGIIGEKNCYRMAAALAVIEKYMTGRADATVRYSNTEITDMIQKYPGIREAINASHNTNGLLPASLLDACYYLFSRKDQSLADEFVDKIVRGTNLEEGTPWYALRERLMKNSMSKSKLPKHYLMALCIKAWNSARSGTPVRCLRWREEGEKSEQFPVIK